MFQRRQCVLQTRLGGFIPQAVQFYPDRVVAMSAPEFGQHTTARNEE